MDCVSVFGIKCYAFHGCIDEEAKAGGYFTVNAKVFGDFKKAAIEDDLSLTVDYVMVSKIVVEEMKKRSKMIESVALRIINRIKEKYTIAQEVEIEIVKHRAPIELDVNHVSVILRA